MAYQGNNIGTSKIIGILDLYVGNVENTPYVGQGGSRYSLQEFNTIGDVKIIGGYGPDLDDGIVVGNHSGKFNYQYQGRNLGHNEMEAFKWRSKDKIIEKPDPPIFNG